MEPKTTTVASLAVLRRKIKKLGYTVKHSVVGWWVDGRCGYQVAGYFDDEKEALEKALEKIQSPDNAGAAWRL